MYTEMEGKFKAVKTKLEILEAEHELIKEVNKSMELVLEGNIVTSTEN